MTSGMYVAVVIGCGVLFVVISGAISLATAKRAMRQMRDTERNAAFVDARNLMVKYRDPAMNGGHASGTVHGHSLQAGERVRRHVCCWFHEDSGAESSVPNWASVSITDKGLLISLSGSAQFSMGASVSFW